MNEKKLSHVKPGMICVLEKMKCRLRRNTARHMELVLRLKFAVLITNNMAKNVTSAPFYLSRVINEIQLQRAHLSMSLEFPRISAP